LQVGVDGVGPVVLFDVREQLVDESDATTFVAGDVDEHPTSFCADRPQRLAQLNPAITTQRAEDIPGEAFGVEAGENVVAIADLAGDQRDIDPTGGVFERAGLEQTERGRHRDVHDLSEFGCAVVCIERPHRAMITMMLSAQALWFIGPREVRTADVEIPPLRDGDVLVQTVYSGISSGTELLAYRGEIDPELALDETIGALGGTFRYPFRYGYSCVGVVEASRGGVEEGALVFAFHPHQDRFVASATDVVPLGPVDPRTATLFPLVETALQITLDAAPLLDDEVVVYGLGAVGTLTAVLLGRAGARVVAVDPLSWRRDTAASLGVAAVAPEDLTAALSARAARLGVPLVIEASGRPEVLAASLRLLAHEGTALVASWYGTKDVTLPLGAEFHRRRLTIRSTQVSTIPARLSDRWTAGRRRAVTGELLNTLHLEPLATHVFPFASAPEAFAAVDKAVPGLIHAAMWYG
jgi:2-desacetyl-2-hydroxyethyl bacteriochlorophyllide A dehydrogenase